MFVFVVYRHGYRSYQTSDRRDLTYFLRLLTTFVILTFSIYDLVGDFQGKKLKISLSLTWLIDKIYECTTH